MRTTRKLSLAFLTLGGLIISLSACSSNSSVTGGNNNGPSNQITSTTLSGHIKGTMTTGKTYTVNGDVYVDKPDT